MTSIVSALIGKNVYEGIIMIPFKVKLTGKKDSDGNEIVKFSSTSEVGDEAIFVKNIKESGFLPFGIPTPFDPFFPKFTATKVDNPVGEETWDGNGKTPLLAVHGWLGRSDIWYETCEDAIKDEFEGDKSKFNLVPVMWWPTSIFLNDYYESRKVSAKAGKLYAERLSKDDVRSSKKSIVTVSMGNFLLKEMANAAPKDAAGKNKLSFENIFMSAADVDEDIFSEGKEGANIVDMLANDNSGGKVYVFYNDIDQALEFSTNVWAGDNWKSNISEIGDRIKRNAGILFSPFELIQILFQNPFDVPVQRIGLKGAQNIAPTLKGKVENKNATKFGIKDLGHSYVFYPEVVDIYNDPSKNL